MIASDLELKALRQAVTTTTLYAVFADGRRVGMSVAATEALALQNATKALTRVTPSKDDQQPDYAKITVARLN